MAVNQSHSADRRGAALAYGESLLKQYHGVELSFPQQPENSHFFSGTKRGTLFLTSYRVIFVTSRSVSDPMLSFMMPFDLMKNCAVEQPVFAANYVHGTIQAAPDGGWEGQATFKLVFRKGGAIHFAELMMQAASAAAQGVPLGTVNFWFGPSGIYGITGGSMCTAQMPCPVVIYGAPPAGYAGPPAGYPGPPAGYRGPPPGYGAPPAGYGAPPAGYGAPPPGREAPPIEYGASPAGYEVPPPGYEATPPRREAPPPEHEAPPTMPGASPAEYEAPPGGSGAGSREVAAAQTPK